MLDFFKKIVSCVKSIGRAKHNPHVPLKVILAEGCLEQIRSSINREIQDEHEGIVYLLGQTDGKTTSVMAVVRPESRTSPGSFHVDSVSMAKVVRAAAKFGLQVVGQAHTHPGSAFHSHSDEVGALIRYTGFTSIVFPNYGRNLPRLDGAMVYMYRTSGIFEPLTIDRVQIVPRRVI